MQVLSSVCFIAFQNNTTAHLTTRRMEGARHELRWFLPASMSAQHWSAWILTVDRNDVTRTKLRSFLICIHMHSMYWPLNFFESVHNSCCLNLYYCEIAFLNGRKHTLIVYDRLHSPLQAFAAGIVAVSMEFSWPVHFFWPSNRTNNYWL